MPKHLSFLQNHQLLTSTNKWIKFKLSDLAWHKRQFLVLLLVSARAREGKKCLPALCVLLNLTNQIFFYSNNLLQINVVEILSTKISTPSLFWCYKYHQSMNISIYKCKLLTKNSKTFLWQLTDERSPHKGKYHTGLECQICIKNGFSRVTYGVKSTSVLVWKGLMEKSFLQFSKAGCIFTHRCKYKSRLNQLRNTVMDAQESWSPTIWSANTGTIMMMEDTYRSQDTRLMGSSR